MSQKKFNSVEERVKNQLKVFKGAQLKTIQRYMREAQANGMSLKTISGNLYFLAKMSKLSSKPFEKFDKDDFMKFLAEVRNPKSQIFDKKVKPESRYYQKKIRQFWRWMNDGELPKCVKWVDPRQKRSDRKEDKKILTDEQKKKMLRLVKHPRDRTMLILMFDSGARPGEIVNLKVGDIEFDEHGAVLHIKKGKTGERSIRLIDSVPDIQAWVNQHPKRDEPKADLFFNVSKNRYGESITWSAIHMMFRNLKKEMGIKGSFSPYVCRRTSLTEMGRVLTPHELKTFAGHSSIRTSDYYVRIKADDVNKKILQTRGLIPEDEIENKDSVLKPIRCPRCKVQNPADSKFCSGCGLVIDKAVARRDIYSVKEKAVQEAIKQNKPINKALVKEVLKEMIRAGEIKI